MRSETLARYVALVLMLAPGTRALAWHRLEPGTGAWLTEGGGAIRGVTIGPIESSLYPGRGYGTPSSEALLDNLERMGVNWISITPFGRVWDLRSTDIE